jgi:adenylyltransferase/sulfurtransferase
VTLSQKELQRYSRHLMLPEIGLQGQIKLKKSKVLLVGAGGLGSPLAIYLAAAGVGTLGLVDFDVVDYTNLHRQVIHNTDDVGKLKITSAKEKISKLNPEVTLITYETALTAKNALEILKDYDLVVDGTDNFPTRYLVNDACVLLNKVNVYGSIFHFEGQVSLFGMKDGPCYRCLFPEPPDPGLIPSCAEGGVLGVLPGIIGLLQANEAIKLICEIGEPLKGRLLYFDALKMKFKEMKIRKDPKCPLCGDNRSIHTLIDYQQFCGIPHPENKKEKSMSDAIGLMSVQELQKRLQDKKTDFILVDVREEKEYAIAHIEGAILKPLSELEFDYEDLSKDQEIAIHCRTGGRSMRACQFLQTKGYTKLYNVTGGITAWAQEIDSSVPIY